LVSSTILHYRIVKKLGAGGMGEVFLAEDTKLERKVAIKMLSSGSIGDEQAKKRLVREAKAAAILDHENICAVYEVNEEDDCAFIVMQYIEGETLSRRINKRPLDTKDAIDIVSQVAEALAEAHSHGVIHRDIKPQNIILTARGRVKVLDFGLAKHVQREEALDTGAITQSQLTEPGGMVGTPAYMSPEQLRGEQPDPRSDLFSLGIVLYECCTGGSPFPGVNRIDLLASIVQFDPPPPSQFNPAVPAELDAITMKALAKKTDSRYQSATQMLLDLRKLREVFQAASEAPTQKLPPKVERLGVTVQAGLTKALRQRISFIAGLVILALVVVVAMLLAPRFWRTGQHQPLSDAKRWYERGTAALRDGAYYQASKMLERSVELDVKFALAHARLAEAYTEIDSTDNAKDAVIRVSNLGSDQSVLSQEDATYIKAVTATVARDFSEAIKQYQKILERATELEKPSVYVDLGRSYEKNEELEKAMGSYLEATRGDLQSGAAFLRLGILYGRQQNVRSATEHFDKAEKIYRASRNLEGVAEVLYQRGTLLNRMGKLKDARTQLQDALAATQTLETKYQQIRILLQLSNISYNGGDTEQAKQLATDAIGLAQSSGIDALATEGLIDLGNTFLFRSEYDDADRYLKQALDVARRGKARRSEARALLQLGSLNVQRANPDEAILYIKQAQDFFEPGGYNRESFMASILLGRAYREKGDYDVALQIFEEQLRLGEARGDPSQAAVSHQSIGGLFVNYMERFPEALVHIDESCKFNEERGQLSTLGHCLVNRGTALWQLGRYKEAATALEQSLSIADRPEASYKELRAWVHLAYAQMALSQRRFAAAKSKAQQAVTLASTQFKDVAVQATSTLGLAQALSGSPQAGKALCQRAAKLAKDQGDPHALSGALLALAEATLETQDAQGAVTVALEVQERFERSRQQESEWHAWLIAARATRLAGDRPAMRDYASRAQSALSSLEQKWGAEAYNSYLTRPDSQTCRKLINQMLAIN
jgi:tetratricopeptide (TPR) repeat protein/tRNA A-37 threonylcarbamoyl transferase component Bud32